MTSEFDILAAEFVDPEMNQQFGSRAQVKVWIGKDDSKFAMVDAILYPEKHHEPEQFAFVDNPNGDDVSEMTREVLFTATGNADGLITTASKLEINQQVWRVRRILAREATAVRVEASRKLKHRDVHVSSGRGRS